MKRKWLYAIAGVAGAVSGVAVYLWNKNKEADDDAGFSVDVSPDVPDELVPEARSAGCFVAEACEGSNVSVIDVCEFAASRVYSVMAGTKEKRVMVDNEGTKELGNLHKASDEVYMAVGDCSC